SDSATPEVDIVFGVLRQFLVDDDVRNLNPAAGLEHPVDLPHDRHLVWAEVDHSIADDHVYRRLIDRERLSEALAEFDVGDPCFLGAGGGLLQHRRGHVDGDYTARLTDLTGCDQAVEPRPAADIEHSLAGHPLSHAEWIAGTGKRFERSPGPGLETIVCVCSHQDERLAG